MLPPSRKIFCECLVDNQIQRVASTLYNLARRPTCYTWRCGSPASQVVRQPSAADQAAAQSAVESAGPSLASTIIGTASKYLGFPYVWGGSTPGVGFDCSGYTWWIFREIGRPLPRDLWGQLQAGQRVDYDSLQVGDMIFFVNTYQPGLSHNGLYIGGGRFIHAASENTGVIISSLSNAYWSNRYYAASRHW